ncbi:MAG TPA: sialidase family protein, partial [Tepidisphaeraceae bacterium]|nr:sialidase family protein [Tepidisphaeraceae bacterium]
MRKRVNRMRGNGLAWVAVIALFTGPFARGGDEPMKTNLLEAGTGGYATYRIPGIVITKSGTILAYCEARRSGTLDWDTIDVMLRRSTDGGKTWDKPRVIATAPEGTSPNPAPIARHVHQTGKTTNNPVAIVDPQSGAVVFLYCINYQQCYAMRSEDDGKTFSKPVEITATFEKFRPEYDWKVIATGPGHGIRLTSGRLVVPVWLSTSTGNNAHHPSCVSTIYSDDGGKTWNRGDIVAGNTPETPDPNETAIAQAADGRTILNIRNESKKNRRLVSSSKDGATQWSKPAFDEALFEPVCFASLAAVPGTENRLLFCNPDSSDSVSKSVSHPRRNLTVRLSNDGAATWPV